MSLDAELAAATLALDELMSNDELLIELINARPDTPETHEYDSQMRDRTEVILATGGLRARHEDVPDWLRLSMLREFTGWVKGANRTCLHNPDYRQPQFVVTVAWRPNTTFCIRCSDLLMPKPGSEDDRRCDQCGRVTEGVLGSDPVYVSYVAIGPFVFMFGVCTDCLNTLPARFHKDEPS